MIDWLINFSLLFLSFIGLGIFILNRLKIEMAFVPIFLFSSITVLLFCAGLINILPLMVWIIYYGGLILCLVYFYSILTARNPLHYKKILTPSSFFFVFLTVILMLQLKGVSYTHYDNFSHWGLIVKEMYLINGLPDSSTVIEFKNYPPGTAVFIYYILKIVGYAESYSLMAQSLLIVACLTVLFAFTSWKKPLTIIFNVLTVIVLMTISINNESNIVAHNFNSRYNLLVDIVIGMVAFTNVLIAFYYRSDWKKSVLVNTPILILLILIKDSAKLFLVINAFVIIYFIYNHHIKGNVNKMSIKILLKTFLFIIGIPSIISYLWFKYTEKAYQSSYSENKFAVTSSKLTEINKSEEFMDTLAPKMMESLINLEAFQIYLYMNLALILCLILFYVTNKVISNHLKNGLILINGAFLLYFCSLYLMYLYLMPEGEATRLASYDRYLTTIIVYVSAIGLSVLILELNHIRSNAIKGCFVLFSIVLFAFPVYDNVGIFVDRPDIKDTIRGKVRPIVQKIQYQGDADPSILYYSPESKQDSGYLKYIALFEQVSTNYRIVSSCESKEEKDSFRSLLEQYQYVALIKNDQSSCISSFIPNEAAGAYKINKVDDKILLERLE